jgi:uncharacterized protein YbjT (DUF2867 family)
VVGATGGLGQATVAASLSRGHETAALVRDPSRAAFPEPVEVVQGDVLDRPTRRRRSEWCAKATSTGCWSGPRDS